MDKYTDGTQWQSQILEQVLESAKQWRLATVIACVAVLVMAVGIVIVASRSSIEPVLVVLNKNMVPIGVGGSSDIPADNDILIKSMLAKVVRRLRTVSVDYEIQRLYFDDLSEFILPSSRSHLKVREMLGEPETNPFQRANKVSVDVHIELLLRLTANTWQVKWTEKVRGKKGKLLEIATFLGNFNYVIAKPATRESLLINPIGFIVIDFNITRVKS